MIPCDQLGGFSNMKIQRLTVYFTCNGFKYSVEKNIDRQKETLKESFSELVELISAHYETWEFQSAFSFTIEKPDISINEKIIEEC